MSRTEDAKLNNIFANPNSKLATRYPSNTFTNNNPNSKLETRYPGFSFQTSDPDSTFSFQDDEITVDGNGNPVVVKKDDELTRTEDARINNKLIHSEDDANVFTDEGTRTTDAIENNVLVNKNDDGTDLGPVDPYENLRKFRGPDGIDFEDKESIKELQGYLGVEQDGMFGPITEKAWRLAVAGMDRSDEKEVLKYNFNQQDLNRRMAESKLGLGGLLKQGYTNLDKNVFGGWLPWGHRRGLENMSADEYYGNVDSKSAPVSEEMVNAEDGPSGEWHEYKMKHFPWYRKRHSGQ